MFLGLKTVRFETVQKNLCHAIRLQYIVIMVGSIIINQKEGTEYLFYRISNLELIVVCIFNLILYTFKYIVISMNGMMDGLVTNVTKMFSLYSVLIIFCISVYIILIAFQTEFFNFLRTYYFPDLKQHSNSGFIVDRQL